MEQFIETDSHYLPSGTLLKEGSYRIDGKLGEGGFGITYRATDLRDPDELAEVVIKELYRQDFCDRNKQTNAVYIQKNDQRIEFEKLVSKQLEEGYTLSRLDHDHIVMNLDTFKENGTAYIVMNRLIGTDLGELLDLHKSLPSAKALKYTLHILSALRYIHERGITHLDIKPSNIFIRTRREITQDDGKILLIPDDSAVLIDFGASLAYDQSGQVKSTTTKLISGISSYAPIEQSSLSHLKKFDPTLDTFSLAGTFYHCLTAEMPTPPSLRVSGNSALPPPTELMPDAGLNPLFDEVVIKGLDTTTAKRFQTAGDFLAACLQLPMGKEYQAMQTAATLMCEYYKASDAASPATALKLQNAGKRIAVIKEAIAILDQEPASGSEANELQNVLSDYQQILKEETISLRGHERTFRFNTLLSILEKAPEFEDNGLVAALREDKAFLSPSGSDLRSLVINWASASDDELELRLALTRHLASQLTNMLPESSLRTLVENIKESGVEHCSDTSIKRLLDELVEKLEYTRVLQFERDIAPVTPDFKLPSIAAEEKIAEPEETIDKVGLVVGQRNAVEELLSVRKVKSMRWIIYRAAALLLIASIGGAIVYWQGNRAALNTETSQQLMPTPDSTVKKEDSVKTIAADTQKKQAPILRTVQPPDSTPSKPAADPIKVDKIPETPALALKQFETALKSDQLNDVQLSAMVKAYPDIKEDVVNRLAQKAAKIFDAENDDHHISQRYSAAALKLYYADKNRVPIDSILFDFIVHNAKK